MCRYRDKMIQAFNEGDRAKQTLIHAATADHVPLERSKEEWEQTKYIARKKKARKGCLSGKEIPSRLMQVVDIQEDYDGEFIPNGSAKSQESPPPNEIDDDLFNTAMEELRFLVEDGDPTSIRYAINKRIPDMKSETAEGTVEHNILKEQHKAMKELSKKVELIYEALNLKNK